MSENIEIDYIEFSVTNMNQTKEFYSKAFGWEFTDYAPEYTGIKKASGGEMGGFSLVDAVTTGGPLIVLKANELEKCFQTVKDMGTEITKEIFSFPGGRRFEFKDPSGNNLAVWGE